MIKSFRRYKRERDAYFTEGQEEIKKANLVTMFQTTAATVMIVCLLMAITPFIIEGWTPAITHIVLVVCAAVFFFISFALLRSHDVSHQVVDGFCLLFIAVIFAFVIRLDVFEYTDAASSFMEAILLVIPALFTFRFYILYTEIVFFEIVYTICTFLVKDSVTANSDVFNSVVGLLLSIVVAYIIQRLRAEAFHAQKQYRQLSMTDGLTGIMNKANCEHFVKQYLSERMPMDRCALMIIDIDNFKSINDSMGHQMGDSILSAVGTALNQCFRSTDILGRIGGDEFMVLMRGVPSEIVVESKCERIFARIQGVSDDFNMELSCSIGIGLLEGEDAEYDEIFQIADDALYEAKASGKARYSMHRVNDNVVEQIGDKPLALIADDNDMDRVILKAALEKHFQFIEADSGAKAIEQIGKYRDQLDIVILDLIMPDVDGYRVLEYMKERKRISRIPVVVVSSDEKSEKDVLQLGAADMIVKPFDAEVVEIRILNVLKRNKDTMKIHKVHKEEGIAYESK